MTKIRVHEYAKKVNRSSKEVIDELGKINVAVTNHMSTIDTEAVSKLDKSFGGNKSAQEAPKTNVKSNEQKVAPKNTRPSTGGPSRPAQGGQNRPATTSGGPSRPAQGGQNRPATTSGGPSRPAQGGQNRPATTSGGPSRPAQGGQNRPATTSGGPSRPAQGGQNRPKQQLAAQAVQVLLLHQDLLHVHKVVGRTVAVVVHQRGELTKVEEDTVQLQLQKWKDHYLKKSHSMNRFQ